MSATAPGGGGGVTGRVPGGGGGVVAFLGPEGTFTSEAVALVAPHRERTPLVTIADVIAAVRSGEAACGVVPIENSIEGSVNLTLDALAFDAPGAYVCGEITLPISLNLLARDGTALADVREIRSHPMAPPQARRWLEEHLPDVPVTTTSSTAAAAEQALQGPGIAAIANRGAAERFGLAVLAEDIQDHSGNTTRFVVLGRRLPVATGSDKTSVVVFFAKDHPGQLQRVLDEFALRGINLTKIESRPTKQRLGEYCIFIDAAAHLTEPRMGEALRSVHRHVARVRVLGTYPRADGIVERAPSADSSEAYAEAGRWYQELLELIG